MTRRIPHVVDGVLRAREPVGTREIAVDSPDWFAWLDDQTTHSFSFQGLRGTLTARKEHRTGGDAGYWSAYRKGGRKLCKAYLGKTAAAAGFGAIEYKALQILAAQVAYLLFADHPADAIHDIRFAATIRAHNARNVLIKVHDGFIGKTFKAFDLQTF